MIKWGQKSKPKNIPGPKFNPLPPPSPTPTKKSPMPNFLAVKTSRKHYDVTKKKMQTLVLSTQKNPYLNQATPKKSFDHPCHVQSKVPPEVSQSSQLDFYV